MPLKHEDYVHLLPGAHRGRLSQAELEALAKSFANTRSGEPANSGITKEAGMKMISDAADDAEERMREKQKKETQQDAKKAS